MKGGDEEEETQRPPQLDNSFEWSLTIMGPRRVANEHSFS